MSSEAKQPACSDEQAEMVVTIVANLELPLQADPSAAPSAPRFAHTETVPLQSASLPSSIQSVIEEAIRNADDDVEKALIEALRSTRT